MARQDRDEPDVGVPVRAAAKPGANWRISERQWSALTTVRTARPRPLESEWKLFAAACTVISVTLFFVTDKLVDEALFFCLVSGFLGAFFGLNEPFWNHVWRRKFNAVAQFNGRDVALLDRGPPRLDYQRMRSDPSWELLTMYVTDQAVTLQPSEAPIGDPSFDAVLGLSGTDLQRALLGPTLRLNAPHWAKDDRFRIVDGQGQLRLPALSDGDHARVNRVFEVLGAYADRLNAPPAEALAGLASDITHPFDAARALALLYGGWPLQAEAVRVQIGQTPRGAALARIAFTGEGLLDPALDWPTRIAIARGVLGQSSPACDRLATRLQTDVYTNVVDTMALIDLRDTAELLGLGAEFSAENETALAWLCAQDDPAAMLWLHARADRDSTTRAVLHTHHARIADQSAGQLSLGDEGRAGALSESR